MKSDMTLVELARELQAQAISRKDYVASESALTAHTVADDGGKRAVMLGVEGVGDHTVTSHAHGQIGAHLGIPARYYSRMMDTAPELLCTNINHWLQSHGDKSRLVRTLGGSVRGFLSNSYRPLDNQDFAEAALNELRNIGGVTVESCAITDTRMYIKAVSARLEGDIRVGDTVRMGVSLTNSEVGAGTLRIDPFIYRLVCTNGAVVREHVGTYAKRHVGKRILSDVDVSELLSDEAREADDKAIWLAVRDVIRGIFDRERFESILETWRAGAERKIESHTPYVVAVTLKEHKLPDSMRSDILEHLIRGGDFSQYGLGNAVTRYAQDVESYETSHELEEIGADILSMDAKPWSRLVYLAEQMATA